jgi:hypothetical protein
MRVRLKRRLKMEGHLQNRRTMQTKMIADFPIAKAREAGAEGEDARGDNDGEDVDAGMDEAEAKRRGTLIMIPAEKREATIQKEKTILAILPTSARMGWIRLNLRVPRRTHKRLLK